MTDDGLPARRAALHALQQVDEDGAYSNVAVPAAVGGLAEPRDRAFASHLAYDTLRWEGTLDWALGHVLTRSLGQVEPALVRVLRLGALQLLRTDVPPRAAVSTSAALAGEAVPRRRRQGATGFVNGVLRALDRQRDQLPWPSPDDVVAHLVLATAHPRWIVEDLVARYGAERAAAVLAADNEPPGVTLRAVGDRDALVAELRAGGVEATPGLLAPEAVRAPGADPRRLAAVAEGRARPQDEASMVVAHATAVSPGDRVLEIGAGPGGKSTHLAALVGSRGEVVAVELHPHRARLVEEAAAELGVDVTVRTGDATDPDVLDDLGVFDVVLVDAPCSDLGTGRRRPEVRWRRSPADVASLAGLQERLLHRAADQVRNGGRLTYSVCTWTSAETVDRVRQLLSARPDLVLEHEQQLLPDRDDTDGMYVARLRRQARELSGTRGTLGYSRSDRHGPSTPGELRPVELRLAPSILSADFARLAEEIATIEPVAHLVHVDVMDGHYVPNLTIGPGVVRCLREVTDLPFDTHLMIDDPRRYAPQFVDAGSDSVTFHPLVDEDPQGLIDELHERGAQVGIAVKPGEDLAHFEGLFADLDLLLIMTVEPGFGGQSFMPEVMPKVERAAALRDEHGYRYAIEVDGGISPDTVGQAVAAGADTLVAGSAVFGHADRVAAGNAILEAGRAAAPQRVG